ncbi:MAG: DMT family transporter [Porticoccaceae bacterium]|nr:DMT family transporter [Porticoccaceae bacterium]
MALLAFAGNSVLCRLALNSGEIDAASFTSFRLFSGAVFLLILVAIKTRKVIDVKSGSWLSAMFLFAYAITFSYAYISLDTGTGALILFGAVQITMIVSGLIKGNMLSIVEWIGLALAFTGLCILLLPGASSPSLVGFFLMAISGIAWGFYTLAGRGSKSPLIDTTNNFLRTIPLVLLIMFFTIADTEISNRGVVLAVASGALASGLGYAIWYTALAGLTVTQAAVAQLSVPIIAAFGGVIFSSETINTGLIVSSVFILGGIATVVASKKVRAN